MKTYIVELSQRLGSNALEFQHPQLSPQVSPNYFSTPTTHGPRLGDAQGSQPPPNWIVPSSQAPLLEMPPRGLSLNNGCIIPKDRPLEILLRDGNLRSGCTLVNQ